MIQDYDTASLTDFIGVTPERSENGCLVWEVADADNQLRLEVADAGASFLFSLKQQDNEYAAIKQSGVRSFHISEGQDALLLEAEDDATPRSYIQTRLVIRPRLEVISHAKVLSDAISQGVNWRELEEIMGSAGTIDPSGTISFATDMDNGQTMELTIGEEGWSATVAFLKNSERVISSTIEEVQYFTAAKDKQTMTLVAKTGTTSCLTRVVLRPVPSFSTNLQLL